MDNPQVTGKWSQEEIDFVYQNLDKTSYWIAKELKRSRGTVKNMLRGLKKKKYNEIPEGFVPCSRDENYLVNRNGDILRRDTHRKLTHYVDSKGYARVCLSKKTSTKVHRLVIEAFVPNFEGKPQVNHKNGNKLDNRADNLEWATNQENQKHAIELGLWDGISKKISERQKGSSNTMSKLTEEQVIEIFKSSKTNSELAKDYQVSYETIRGIKVGRRWQHLTDNLND